MALRVDLRTAKCGRRIAGRGFGHYHRVSPRRRPLPSRGEDFWRPNAFTTGAFTRVTARSAIGKRSLGVLASEHGILDLGPERVLDLSVIRQRPVACHLVGLLKLGLQHGMRKADPAACTLRARPYQPRGWR